MSVRSSTVAVRRIDAYRPSRPERDVLIAGMLALQQAEGFYSGSVASTVSWDREAV